ncbi:hypothetical protein [Hymenobacter mucosus]|uniref:Uncharacterized protein n=1 Tax=Hymenobacter mucosus TaxID=1411120 RepID=A0A239AAU9_9BACT|nr:hypothetical protein [Hymenobacter mucosus]SNR92003.1 hypothetical protein SAMN06269173_11168 [Hymenobacter mucosus]
MTSKPPRTSNYDKLLQVCLDLHEEYEDHSKPGGYKLGSHDPENARITLYNVENTPAGLATLRKKLDAVKVSYRLVVLEPHRYHSNIHLMDIDV